MQIAICLALVTYAKITKPSTNTHESHWSLTNTCTTDVHTSCISAVQVFGTDQDFDGSAIWAWGSIVTRSPCWSHTHTTVNVLQQEFCCACWLHCTQPNSLKDCNPCTLNCHCCCQPWDWWWYVVAVALVAVARLRDLVSVSRMCLKLMWATRTTAILCEQSNNGLSAGNSNGHTGFIWSCEKVVGQRWGKVPVILAFCTVCNLWNIFSKASSLNDCLKVLSEDTLGENVWQVARLHAAGTSGSLAAMSCKKSWMKHLSQQLGCMLAVS